MGRSWRLHDRRWGRQALAIGAAAAALLCAGCSSLSREASWTEVVAAADGPHRHEQLAAEYRRRADVARGEAEECLKLAAAYRSRRSVKSPYPPGLEEEVIRFVEALVRNNKDEATFYEALAIDHDVLADRATGDSDASVR